MPWSMSSRSRADDDTKHAKPAIPGSAKHKTEAEVNQHEVFESCNHCKQIVNELRWAASC